MASAYECVYYYMHLALIFDLRWTMSHTPASKRLESGADRPLHCDGQIQRRAWAPRAGCRQSLGAIQKPLLRDCIILKVLPPHTHTFSPDSSLRPAVQPPPLVQICPGLSSHVLLKSHLKSKGAMRGPDAMLYLVCSLHTSSIQLTTSSKFFSALMSAGTPTAAFL